MTNDILVFGEQRNDQLHPAALQIVTVARHLAGKTGGRVHAVVIGGPVESAAAAIDRADLDGLLTISDPLLANYSALRYRTALSAAIAQVKPRIVLLPATFMGRDLAPRVAVRTQAALATDVVALDIGPDGALVARRPIYNGKATAGVVFSRARLAIASVRPNAFAAPAPSAGGAPRTAVPYVPAAGDDRLTVKDVVKAGGEVKDVAEADIIVSGGRALKSAENFKILYDLAKELDGAVGASRAACDAGYQPHSRQVGLTGKTVTPRLYLACGISGAIQHLAGMRGSKVIVAINTDKEAPLVKIADYVILGDLFKVVPALTEEIRRLKG